MGKLINGLLGFYLKLKRHSLQFVFLFLIWLIGFIVFAQTEVHDDYWDLFLISVGVRLPQNSGDFAGLFALIWPILLEVVFFGFVMGELFEKFNPVVMSRIKAGHKRNHAIIIGYNNLGERIVDYCIKNHKPFLVIEDDDEAVEDLVSAGYPAIIGDATEDSNLLYANVENAREVFLCVDKVNINIICVDKIRRYNNKVPIYVRAFESHVRGYMRQDYKGVIPFSTSKWTMDYIKQWTKNKKGNAVVVGRDYLTHRIAHHISLQPGRHVYLFDDVHDGTVFEENEEFHLVEQCACFLSDLRENVNLDEIEQIFICYNEDKDFDESLYLASKIYLRHPQIELFVRIFDKELGYLVKKYNATTFSSSELAFNRLQEQVAKNSVLALKK